MFRRVWRGDVEISSQERGPEPPDFVAYLSSGQKIGIELTRVIDPGLAQMSARQNLFEIEFDKICGQEGIRGTFSLRFDEKDGASLDTSRKRRALIAKLIELRRDPAYVGRDLYRSELKQVGVLGIENAMIVDDDEACALVVGTSATTRGLSAILDRVRAKEADVPRCRASLAGLELWLLVVATEAFAGWVATEEVRSANKIQTGFDRVFFMDAHTAEVLTWEL